MIEPTTPIAVTMSAQQWNAVMVQLAEGPYRLVAPLLDAIQRQCMAHEAPMRVPGGANGADPHLPEAA